MNTTNYKMLFILHLQPQQILIFFFNFFITFKINYYFVFIYQIQEWDTDFLSHSIHIFENQLN